MANINLVFEVVFHGLMETTSPQSAAEPVPQPSSLQLPMDHRALVFSVFQCWHPAVCSHPGVGTWWRGKHRRLGSCLLGSLLLHPQQCQDRAGAARGAHKSSLRCAIPPCLPPLSSLSHSSSPQHCGSLPALCTASGYLSLLCLADSLLT